MAEKITLKQMAELLHIGMTSAYLLKKQPGFPRLSDLRFPGCQMRRSRKGILTRSGPRGSSGFSADSPRRR